MTDNPSEKVRVRLSDQVGGKIRQAEIPVDAPVNRLIPALVKRMELPEGRQYSIQHKESGKLLRPDSTETLANVGVKEGDTLRLIAELIAG